MTVAVEHTPETDFNRQFKDEFARLFRRRHKNADKISGALVRMIAYVSRGWKFIGDTKEDITQDVLLHCLNVIPKVDADDNPAAWYRTTINREIGRLVRDYAGKSMEELGENVVESFTAHDPIAYARECREEVNFLLSDLNSRVTACKFFDMVIEDQARRASECEDGEQVRGCEIAAMAYQLGRKRLVGEYKSLVVGTIKFLPQTFIRFDASGA